MLQNTGKHCDMCRCDVVVITIAQLHLTKAELKIYTGLNPALGVSQVCYDNENL